ncbi:hypothetical protein BGZ76_010579 [Entomortierella beljakovae]|nr:hypothetical protein BGZ76_010579 [Entomortierella beljakovae]
MILSGASANVSANICKLDKPYTFTAFSSTPLLAISTKTHFESDNNHVTPVDQEILPNENDGELGSVSNGDNDDDTTETPENVATVAKSQLQIYRYGISVASTKTEKPGTSDIEREYELAKIKTNADIEREKTSQFKEKTTRSKEESERAKEVQRPYYSKSM